MAKTRTIPSYDYPIWKCEIAGTKYTFPSGATMSVPDAVAELIDQIIASEPKEVQAPDGSVWTKEGNGAGWNEIEEGATYTAGDNITIEDNVISATDTTYTAGYGITITDKVIAVSIPNANGVSF